MVRSDLGEGELILGLGSIEHYRIALLNAVKEEN